MNETRACKACGHKILFLRTERGQGMPVDVSDSALVAHRDGLLWSDSLKEQGIVPHWSTCTAPKQFRRRG